MKAPLSILHLEDDPNDAEAARMVLESEDVPCTITRVQSRENFVSELEKGNVDLVLSDFTLPAFDGLSAIGIVQARWPDVPVILVSGTLGEELAIDSLKSGATDYVLKGRLSRLVPAVQRAMREVGARAERRQLEAQLIEAQKMEIIGQFSGGLAHDFGNLIGVIIGYSSLVASALDADSPLNGYVEEIQCASERAAGLTRQLMLFSYKEAVAPIVLDPNTVVADLDRLLRQLIDEKIKLTIIPGREIGRIKADPGYIGQVLMNLVVNARDAMPNGGEITIATSNAELDGKQAGTAPGNYVVLSVSDTGTGMTEEVKAHLFEAFFTTKAKGNGTGLGLATCQTIAQQCRGHIGVDSEIGKGTTFRIYLPRVDQPLEGPEEPARNAPLPHGTEALLVVEDDPPVRRLACTVLEDVGYEVLTASNGQDALRVARERKGSPISLVVTDIIMPVMGGEVMAEWLKTTFPELKILFTSGYTGEALTNHGALKAGIAFLPKPYTPATLVQRVREMLDDPGEPAVEPGKVSAH